MARSIATLGVSVTARTRGFNKKIGGARRTVQGFSKSVMGIAAKLGGLATALTGVAGAAGLVAMTKSSMKAIKSSRDFANMLGIQTDKLIGLRHAAKLAGVDQRKFDMGLQRFTRRLAEASLETGEAQAAFKALGIDAKEMMTLPLAERLNRVADAMAGIPQQALKVLLGFKQFDSEGVALIRVLAGGSRALRAAQADAEKLNLTFSEFDAMAVDKAVKAVMRLGTRLTALGNLLGITLAPYIETVANKLTEMGDAGIDAGEVIREAMETAALFTAIAAERIEGILRSLVPQIASWKAKLQRAFLLQLGAFLADTKTGKWAEDLEKNFGISAEGILATVEELDREIEGLGETLEDALNISEGKFSKPLLDYFAKVRAGLNKVEDEWMGPPSSLAPDAGKIPLALLKAFGVGAAAEKAAKKAAEKAAKKLAAWMKRSAGFREIAPGMVKLPGLGTPTTARRAQKVTSDADQPMLRLLEQIMNNTASGGGVAVTG